MARIIEVTDLNDPALACFAQLTNAQLRNRLEPELGVLVAESPKVIRVALDAGLEPVSFLMERGKLEAVPDLLDRCDVPVYTADREVLASLAGYALTRGVLCAMRRPVLTEPETVLAGARRAAVLERVVDAVNMGAIFRSAAALGIDAVLLGAGCCDPLCRRAVRVGMGAVFQVPWAVLGGSFAEWPGPGLERLRALGFQTAALALRDDALSIDDPRLAQVERLAVLLGAEGDGLAPGTIDACDWTVKIPMSHGVDSLNVAAAAAVAFWALRPH